MSELVRIAIKDLEAFAARAYVAVGISAAEAKNIAELIIYIVKGEDVRHSSIEQIESTLQ